MGDHWFPKDRDQIRKHGEEMPKEILAHAVEGREFIAASIQIPDKPLHAKGEGHASDQEIKEVTREFDQHVKDMVEGLEEEGFDWVIMGDHGSPWPGNIKIPETKQFVPNHRKSSVIISNMDVQLPTYTEDIHEFILDYFDAEPVDYEDLGLSYINQMAAGEVKPGEKQLR
jgi:hypothetical protein